MTASGSLAYDGRGWPWEWPLRWLGLIDPKLFTHVTKTVTYLPRKGNLRWSHPWSSVAVFKNGVANAIGLTNPGLDWWIQSIGPKVKQLGHPLICSITDDDPQIAGKMASSLNPIPIKGIEFNASCPNSDQELMSNVEKVIEVVRQIRKNSDHPLILKLSIHQDYLQIAKETENLVEAISINSVPWRVIFPNQKSPLAKLGGGGVSGKIAQNYTWKMVKELSENTKTPVIGPGVWEYADIQRLRDLGAKAISFGSIFMKYPWRPTAFVKKESEIRRQKSECRNQESEE